jgi:hypothetical protein
MGNLCLSAEVQTSLWLISSLLQAMKIIFMTKGTVWGYLAKLDGIIVIMWRLGAALLGK